MTPRCTMLTIERLNRLNPRAPVRNDLVRLLREALS